MTAPTPDPLVEALTRLADNAHWRYYVSTLQHKRDDAIRALLYGPPEEIHALRGEARAFDRIVKQLKDHGVKV